MHQTEEPVLYRYADVTYSHLNEQPVQRTIVHELYTRPGQVSTVVTVPFTVPEFNASHAIRAAVLSGERALAYVVLTLDERVADRRQGELVVVETTDGQLCADVTYAVRSFDGAAETNYPTAAVLAGLKDMDLSPESDVAGPLSLYLHAVEKRYSADGFVLLAAAVDALADAGAFNPQRIRQALSKAGCDWPLANLKRISTARGRLVHNGSVDTQEFYELWYDLEEVTRILLRHRTNAPDGWPARVPMFEGPSFATPEQMDRERRQWRSRIPSWSQILRSSS